jgi:hypothetical protein
VNKNHKGYIFGVLRKKNSILEKKYLELFREEYEKCYSAFSSVNLLAFLSTWHIHNHFSFFFKKKKKTNKNKRTKRMLGDGHLRMLSSISWGIIILYLFEKGIAIPLF